MDTKGQLSFGGVKSYVYIKKLYIDFPLHKAVPNPCVVQGLTVSVPWIRYKTISFAILYTAYVQTEYWKVHIWLEVPMYKYNA